MAETFRLKVLTPTRSFYEGEVTMVEFNTSEGQLGIYKNHIPMTAIIIPGILTIHNDDEKKNASLMSGFVQILPDEITILSETCEWPDEIDEDRANEAKIRAERRLKEKSSELNLARAELALKRALVRLDVKNS